MRARFLALSAAATLVFVSACGGGGGGGSSGATADILIGDAPKDDLLSFSAVVESVRLQRDDLTFTGDLSGSLRVEFLGLNGSLVFLGKGAIPAGTYIAVEIGFEHGSYQARADDSSPVTIVASDDTYLAALPAPLVVAVGDYVRFAVDLDLTSALTGVVANGTLDFGPSGSCDSNDGSEDALIDELKGKVVASSQATRTVTVDGFAGEPPIALGRVNVHVGGTALLLDDDNSLLNVTDFFDRLVNGSTLLEVHGNLVEGGTVEATRIEIEDSPGGGGDSGVRIEGVVASLTSSQFGLQIVQIKDGASIAQPVLDGLADGDTIDVGFDDGTTFLFDQGGLTDSSTLAVGQEVKVRFSAFATEPFPAREVEIDDTPGFHGVLTNLSGAPHHLTLHLDASDAAVRAGRVASADTDVTLVLGSAPIVLAVPGAPSVRVAELFSGLELEPHGLLSGPPGAPVLTATEVRVRPGYLRSTQLQNVAAGGGNVVVDGGEFVDPFGNGVTPGPLLIWIEEGCTFDGDVRSAEDFYRVYGGQLSVGAALDVRGLANGSANEIRAFAVRVKGL